MRVSPDSRTQIIEVCSHISRFFRFGSPYRCRMDKRDGCCSASSGLWILNYFDDCLVCIPSEAKATRDAHIQVSASPSTWRGAVSEKIPPAQHGQEASVVGAGQPALSPYSRSHENVCGQWRPHPRVLDQIWERFGKECVLLPEITHHP